MGPPRQAPSGPFSRKRTARAFSTKPVIIPRKADTHIQNTAPGPPKKMAVATPAMEPVPMVEARAVDRAWALVRPRPFPRLPPSRPAREAPSQRRTPNTWKNPLFTERYSPAARNSPSSPGDHSQSPSRSSTVMSPPPVSGVCGGVRN